MTTAPLKLYRRTGEVIPYLESEVEEFERQVEGLGAGEIDPLAFQAFRLRQGVYGQRQPDVQMIRVKIPGGMLTARQLDALGEIAARFAPLRKGHVTTRENVQYHHVRLEDAATVLRVLGKAGLTSREACGNTVRNVITCPLAGVCRDEAFDVTPYLGAYARWFVRQPLTQSLPRKVKTAFSPCARDCAVTAMHDIGFIAQTRVEGGQVRKGFRIVVGGGTSIMPKLAQTVVEFAPVEEFLRYCEAILRIFNRSDELRRNRMMARIKVLIHRIGIEKFRELVQEELKQPWAEASFDPTPLLYFDPAETEPRPSRNDHDPQPPAPEPAFQRWLSSNVVPQRQEGFCAAHVTLPLGDVTDRQFHALATLARRCANGRARVSAEQNLVLRWVREEALYGLWRGLREIGLGDAGAQEITDVTSCPGTDSCKLGITASMGLGRAIQDGLATEDLADPLVRQMHIKISGCPNGCGRHHVANIGFHGASYKGDGVHPVPAYEVFLGGNFELENGPVRYADRVPGRVPAKLAPEAVHRILDRYRRERQESEPFNDYVLRVGAKSFEPLLAGLKDVAPLSDESQDVYMDWERASLYEVQRGEGECAV